MVWIILLYSVLSFVASMSISSSSSSSSGSCTRKAIVSSFQANPFIARKGFLGLLANPHWQTIICSGAIQQKIMPPPRMFSATKERLTTPDGDFFDVEFTGPLHRGGRNSQGKTVVVLHGLESNTRGPLVNNMAAAFLTKGFSCCLVSFRGCSGEANLTPGAYHIGMTRDVDLVCQTIQSRFPTEKIYLSGFSLGGNVILKYLGELNSGAWETRNIFGAAVSCVPFDPVATQKKTDGVAFNRIVYAQNFLRSLKAKAEDQILKHPGSFDIERVRVATTIGEFDDAFIAPIYGFKDKFDYYLQSGSKQYLSRIAVPAIAINAIDDPLIDASSLPTEAIDVGDAPVRLIYHPQGGHCGFDAEPGVSYPHGPSDTPQHGWMAEELARALDHIHRGTIAHGVIEA